MNDFEVETGETVVRTDGRALELAWAAVTDTGRRREVNQDAVLAAFPVFAVADGMGGHDAGEVASGAVVARLGEAAAGDRLARTDLEGALESAVADMAAAVGDSEMGTGTTLTGLVLEPGAPIGGDGAAWTVFNIGDSRVYRLVGEELSQLTVDHSVVQELLTIGVISPDEAETHPHGNVITRAVGFAGDSTPDYSEPVPASAARWLVCSDGLTKELTDYGVRYFLLGSQTPADAARALTEAALENGGRDNVSVIVLDERIVEAAPAG